LQAPQGALRFASRMLRRSVRHAISKHGFRKVA
jgi:hypothetical protein